MRFSENGLYIEQYVKCANCGILIYQAQAPQQREHDKKTFCSDWCVDWYRKRRTESDTR